MHFWPKIKQLYVTIFLKNWHFYHFLSEDFLGFCVTFGVYIIYGYVLHFWNKIQLLLVLRFSITIRIFTVLSKIQRFYIQIAIFLTIFHQTLLALHYTCHWLWIKIFFTCSKIFTSPFPKRLSKCFGFLGQHEPPSY